MNSKHEQKLNKVTDSQDLVQLLIIWFWNCFKNCGNLIEQMSNFVLF